jgi:hypothetical protein
MANQVLFNPSPTQTKFLEAVFAGNHKYILFGGSIRGGKTYAVLGAILLLCKKYPGSRWVIVRDSLMNLKLTTIPSFFKLCPINFIKRYNQDTQTVTFTNDSQVLFFGEGYEDDKELLRWRGLECSGFVLEECNEMQESSFYKAIERAGTHIPAAPAIKPRPIILLTCNPSKNWVKTLWYDRYKAETLPTDWRYMPSKITDNPYIMADAGYMESLKNMPSYEYSVFVEGDWELQEKSGLEFYKGFDLDKHAADCNYDPTLPLLFSFDENVNPFLTCIVGQLKSVRENGSIRNELRIIDEILGRHPNNTLESVTSMILTKYPPSRHRSVVEIYGDATSRKEDTKLEKGHNFYSLIMGYLKRYVAIRDCVSKSNEGVGIRGAWINAVLEKEVSGVKILIDKQCKQVISDFVLTKENPDRTKHKAMTTDPKTKVRYQTVGHCSDAFDYMLTGKFKCEFNNYKFGGQSSIGIIIGKNPPSKHSY